MKRFLIKFVDESPGLELDVHSMQASAVCLFQKVRVARGWGLDMRIRLIAGGREIHEDEPLQHISKVLHCIATSSEDICKDCCRLAEQEFERQQDDVDLYQQEDWVGTDPNWILLWVFGVILLLASVLYLCNTESYSRQSLTFLGGMTLVYVLVFFPWFYSAVAIPVRWISHRFAAQRHQPIELLTQAETQRLTGALFAPSGSRS